MTTCPVCGADVDGLEGPVPPRPCRWCALSPARGIVLALLVALPIDWALWRFLGWLVHFRS